MVCCAAWMLAAPGMVAAETTDAGRQRRRSPVVEVFERVRDSVVNISSTQIVKLRSSGLFDDLFDLPFSKPHARTYRTNSVGSGFVLHPAGYIVTNAHVVLRTAEREVIFADKHRYDAEIVAVDPQHDLALLKINADRPLQPIMLGTSGDLMVGETVIAIGNALGYQHTVTTGVVSAVDRKVSVRGDVQFTELIQTDASINPGNSGGPLLNVLSELVGINTAIRANAENIGFAIPVDQLRTLLPNMLDVERRYAFRTGLRVTEFDAGNGLRVKIESVDPDSPAEKAGLDKAMVYIDAIDDEPVASVIDYHIALIGRRAGQTLRLRVQFGKSPAQTVKLTLAERPKPNGTKLMTQRLGVEAQAMTTKMARSMGFRRLPGLLVTRVERPSPAADIGVERGDVIIQLDQYQTPSLEAIGELLERVKPGDQMSITILRVAGRSIMRSTTSILAR